jgi:hypothetical protein
LRELEAEGLRFELKVITGMRHDEAVQWYRRADIIVDQLLIGWYGVLTLEGLAMGKPVVVYVREDLFDRFTPRIPIQNAPPGKLKEALRELIADPRRRRELAAAGPDFVRDVHDVRKIAAMLRDIYAEVMEMPMRVPDGHADLEHFLAQFKLLEDRETLLALQFKARSYDALMTELPALRFRARKYGEARDRLRSLQFKARSYDALLSELPALRFRARRYDEMRVEHGRIRETLSAARRALHGKAAP